VYVTRVREEAVQVNALKDWMNKGRSRVSEFCTWRIMMPVRVGIEIMLHFVCCSE